MMPYSHSVIDLSRKSQGITGDFPRTVLTVVQGPGCLGFASYRIKLQIFEGITLRFQHFQT